MIWNEAHMTIAAARYFNPRKNIIVPNVSWGLGFRHECDALILTPSGCAYEVEAKVSKADLKRDKEKAHAHNNKKICKLFFIVPAELRDFALSQIPDRAGLLTVASPTWLWPQKVRDAKIVSDYRWQDHERLNLARLGAMRIWDLLESLNRKDEPILE